ncbi:MAG: hypothetical protein ABJO27_04970 [Pseudoruegeria sp.]
MAQSTKLPAPIVPMGEFPIGEHTDVAGASRVVTSLKTWEVEIPLYLRRAGQVVYDDDTMLRYKVSADLTTLELAQEDVGASLVETTRRTVYQVDGNLPDRPDTTQPCDWYTWSDPTAKMLEGDLRYGVADPVLPTAPTAEQVQKMSIIGHLGNENDLSFEAVPILFPPLVDLSYRIDGGSWLKAGISAVGETMAMPAVSTGQHTLDIAFDNYLGRGAETAMIFTSHGTIYREVFDQASADDHLGDRTGWLDHDSEPHLRWDDGVDAGLSPGFYASSNNDVSMALADFADINTASVWATIIVEQDGIGQECFVGVGSNTSNSIALRIDGPNWDLRRNNSSSIESGSLTEDITSARIEVSADTLTAIVNGTIVSTQLTNDYPQYSDGTLPVFVGIKRPSNSVSHDVYQNRITAFEAGNLS